MKETEQPATTDRPRAIVHLDLDAADRSGRAFAAVEALENPDLAGKPVLVGGRPEERGVVSAASYPARAFGVHSAMPTYRALRLCPEAVVLPPRHRLYRDYSRRVMAILHRTSPLVEQLSVDEAFLGLTERVTAWEEAVETARRLQERVKEEVKLSASLGADMARRARGIDERSVVVEHERKSISQERTFRQDLRELGAVKGHLWRMSLDVPTDDAKMIYQAALVLLRQTWDRERAIRLLGVAGDNLSPLSAQLPLFEGPYG